MHTETFIKIWWLIHYSNPPVVIPQLYCDVHLLRSPCIILSWKTPKRVNCWHPYLRKLFPLIQMVLDIANWLWKSEFDTFLINSYLHKEFFRTCNILPFSCTHLALWRHLQRQSKRPKEQKKKKGFINFFIFTTIEKSNDKKSMQIVVVIRFCFTFGSQLKLFDPGTTPM